MRGGDGRRRLTLRFGSHHFRARAAVLNWGPALLFIGGNNSPVARKKSALSLIKSMPVLGKQFELFPRRRFDKTISQPMMVAVMTDLLELKPDDMALEIGTGLGYQAAVLAELAGRVYSVEIIEELAQRAILRLKRQSYTNVEVRVGNGYTGWPWHAPFDKVIVTAAPDLIPPPLINQLKAGGRMVIPVGLPAAQQLVVVEKDLNGRVTTKEIMPVLFSVLEGSDESAFRAS
jgi:protein-L-isoaspartate(D-aspartate) O-methyltransferase